mmetsp:Transcript_34993/g.73823  ORF Transcript_34993/g.73823 Transcript_34993/m.73823 type:complete len:115 (-) Transcript_34993:461-805(-)
MIIPKQIKPIVHRWEIYRFPPTLPTSLISASRPNQRSLSYQYLILITHKKTNQKLIPYPKIHHITKSHTILICTPTPPTTSQHDYFVFFVSASLSSSLSSLSGILSNHLMGCLL